MNKSQKSILIAAVFLGLTAPPASAGAIPLTSVAFDLLGDSGPLAGETYSGLIEYDASLIDGSGFEAIATPPGFGFSVVIDGSPFNETDDIDYLSDESDPPLTFPVLFFQDGNIEGLGYFGVNGSGDQLSGGAVGAPQGWGFFPGIIDDTTDSGSISFSVSDLEPSTFTMSLANGTGNGVPEAGSSLIFMGLALLGLGAAGKRLDRRRR